MTLTSSEPLAVFFSWLWRSSLQTSVLICLVFAAQIMLRDKLAPRWRYGLWLLVVVRLALPWAPDSRLSVYNLYPFSGGEARVAADWAASKDAIEPDRHVAERPDLSPLASQEPPETSLPKTVELGIPAAGEARSPNAFLTFIPFVWLLGALAVATCIVVESFSLTAAIRRQRFVTDQRTLDLLEDCKEEMGVHTYLAVVETPEVCSPASFGFLRPRLLLPAGMVQSLGLDHLRHVFLHELGHLKRHDIAVNWATAALQALHWFNPLVWYAFHRMRADRELACDASVLLHFETEERSRYGMTIVRLLESFSQRRRLPGLAGVLEDKNLIRRRIEMIARFKKASGRWTTIAVLLTIVLGALTLTNAQQSSAISDLNGKIGRVNVDKATLDDVVRIFGEPKQYVWGDEETGKVETLKREDLPSRQYYIADYGDGFRVFLRNGQIMELRFEDNPQFVYKGRLRAGDSLNDALKFMGTPKSTVSGASRDAFGSDGVLYRDIGGKKGYDYYLRKDKRLRVFFLDDKVKAIYLIRSDFFDSPDDAAPARPGDSKSDLNDLVARLDIDNARLDDVIRLFGKPKRYVWGNEVYKMEDLPFHDNYIVVFGGGLNIAMRNGRIEELRFEQNRQYLHKGKLRGGDSLEDAVKFMGRPKETVVVKKNDFKDGVLYRDIDGRKGYDYYHRKDKDLRLWFLNDRLGAIYVTRSDYGNEDEPPKGVKDVATLRKDRPWIKETTILNANGQLSDKIDYPFVDDPEALGTWKVVDFVQEKDRFVPGRQRWQGNLDFLKGLRFEKEGKVDAKFGDGDWQKGTLHKWTKGLVLCGENGKEKGKTGTASEYEIVRLGGKSYLFYQWKSGDYVIRYQKPCYYVLEKEE